MRIELLALAVFGVFIAGQSIGQNIGQNASKPGGRLDSFQFKSVCELQKRMPNSTSVDCHCAAGVYERFVQAQVARFDDMIKHYEDKMRSEPEKSSTYARAADRQRDQRKQFLDESI